jgi:hypothetical protein
VLWNLNWKVEYIPDPVPETDFDPDPTENRKIKSKKSKNERLFFWETMLSFNIKKARLCTVQFC